MENEAKISRTEKVVINLCTPLLYLIGIGTVPFSEIAGWKETDYRRLIKYVDTDGEIPYNVRREFHGSPCGNLALGASHMRKYLRD
ncbi:MAG: hypothetical protein J4400_02745 [Candidatus Aenigmarchaeota archaeon]|nr:hypothetical protein [Candidatus Aenigmarchaeota archaeon]